MSSSDEDAPPGTDGSRAGCSVSPASRFLAGLLFGSDQGVISGALPLITGDLGLSTLESEIITGWVTLGALLGALVAGGLR